LKEKSMIRNMTEGSVARHLIVFALPVVLANLLQSMYNIVDMIIIGQFVGSAGLSAVAVGGEISHLPMMMSIGFATAGQVMISQYVGMNDRQSINRCVGTILSSLAIAYVLMAGAGLLFLRQIMTLMNAPPEAWDDCRRYVTVCLIGLVFTYGYNAVSAVLRGMGDSRRPLVFIAVATGTNILLDLLFVAVFRWSAFGAALATILSQAVSLVCSLIHLYRRRESFGFDFKLGSFAIRKAQLVPLLKMGLPLAFQWGAINISIMTVNAQINALGVTVSAVTGVGNKLRNVSTVITQSTNTAATAVIAQNLGAGKRDRAARTVWTALGINLVICALISTFLLLFPEGIFGVFTDDAAVLQWAGRYMGSVVVHNFAASMMGPFNSLINGLGYSSLALVVALLDGVAARIGLSMLLGYALELGAMGFWYGGALAGFVTVVLAGGYFLSGRWRKREILVKRQ